MSKHTDGITWCNILLLIIKWKSGDIFNDTMFEPNLIENQQVFY